MKKIFFAFMALFMITNSVLAENSSSLNFTNDKNINEHVTIELNVKNTSIKENYRLDFKSIKEFIDFDENQLKTFIDVNDGVCEVTVTVTVSVTVEASGGVVGGSVTTTASASITASCAEISGAVKKLKKTLLAAIR